MDFGVVSSSIWRKNCGTDGLKFHGPPAMKCVNFTELSPGDRLGDEMNCVVWTSNLTSNVPAFVGWRNFQNLGVPNGYHPTSSISRGRSSVWRNFLFALLGLPPKLCLPARGLELEFELVLLRASIDTDLFWVLIWRIFFSFDLTGLQRRRRWDVKDFSGFVVQSPPRHRPLVGHDGDDVGH